MKSIPSSPAWRRRLARASRALAMLAGAVVLAAAAPRVSVAQQADLVLNITDNPDPLPATGVVTYSVTVTNDAATTATGIQFTLSVPANARYNGFSGSGIACSGLALNATGPGTLTCTLPDLAFTASTSFTVRLRTTAAGIVTVVGNVTSPVPDLQLSNNTVTENTTAVAGADVALVVTSPSTAAAGSTISYGLSLTNAGPDVASSLRVQLPIPTGFTVTAGLPANCASAAGTITCTPPGSIASGGTLVIGNITGQITAASTSTVSGSANVAVTAGAPVGTAQDPDASNNSVVFSTSISSGSDLKITVARSVAAPYFVGNNFNLVLTPSYTGDNPSTLTITDVVPANYTIRSAAFVVSQSGWTCGFSGQTVTCTRAAGVGTGSQSLGTINIPITVASAGVGVTNSATISAASPGDPAPANNTANDGGATLQTPTADLQAIKSGPSPALAVVGQAYNYSLSVRNGGPSAFDGTLTLTDALPTGLTVNAYALNGWSCSPAAPVVGPASITCSRTYTSGAPLASAATTPSAVLNTTATTAGAVTNSIALTTTGANVGDPNAANDAASSTVTVSAAPNAADVHLIKTVDIASVPAGDVLTYTLEVVNDGPVSAGTVTVSDLFGTLINNSVGATGAGFVSFTVVPGAVAPGTITCTTATSGATGRQLTCNIPTLPVCTAGVDCPQIQAAVRPGGNGGARNNSASATSQVTADNNLANNTGSAANTVLARADMRATLTGTPNPTAAGQDLIYVLTAANLGPSQAAGVTATDVLPLNVLFVSAVPSVGSCGTTPGANVVTTSGNRTVTCSIGGVNSAAQATVTIRVRPTTATRGTSITNDVSVATTTTETDAPTLPNNVASVTTNVSVPSLDLLINKSDSVDPLTVGSNTVYTITVNNAGPSDAENVVITDVFPTAGLSYVSSSITVGSCPSLPAAGTIGGSLVCNVTRLASGASVVLTVTMKGEVKGVYSSSATVSSDESGLGFETVGNNSATQATTVRTRADMQVVSVTPSAATIAVRRPFTFTLQLRNNTGAGLAEADTVKLTDNLPAGMELTGTPTVSVTSGTTTLSTCSGTAGSTSFVCQLGTVSSGATLDITVPVRVLTVPVGGTLSTTATVTTTSQDFAPGNDVASGSVAIQGSSLAGKLFRDFDADATPDATDTGINAIPVTLTGTAFDASAVSHSTTTNATGDFSFIDLPEGSYTIQRGTVTEALLVVGPQVAGNRGGTVSVVPSITSIALGGIDVGTGYFFTFIPQARVGVAKRLVGAETASSDGSFTDVIRVLVHNYSRESLSGVAVSDPLTGASPSFGSYVAGGAAATLAAGSYTIQAAPALVGACVGGSANAAFDGSAQTQLAQVTTLAANAACTVEFTLRYRPVPPVGALSNQASATGTGILSAQAPSDLSANGANADPDGDGDPANDNVPTPFAPVAQADVATSVTLPASANAGASVASTVIYRNLGPYAAAAVGYTLTLSPGLSGVTFGNLPLGASASYVSATGGVGFTGMPSAIAASAIASGDGVGGIAVSYIQPGTATSSVASGITTSTPQGANAGPDAASGTVSGALVADVTTTVAGSASANAGTLVSGTIVYQNAGPSIASGVSYGFTLSAGLSGVTFGNLPGGATASYALGTGIVTLGGMPATLASGAIASGNGTTGITVSYTQPGTATSGISSTIATSTSQGANAAPDAATATVSGSLIADVGTTLTFPVSVNAGSPVSGTLVFDNAGPSIASGMTYGLTITSGLPSVTFGNLPVGASATYDATTGVVALVGMPATLASGALASGNGTTGITIAYTQPGSAVSTVSSTIGTSTNQGANVALDAASVSPGGAPVADVRTIVTLPAAADAMQQVSGAVRFTNLGPSPAAGVSYTLGISTGLSSVTFGNLPAGATAAYDATTGVVTLAGMPTTLASGAIASGDGTADITFQYTQPPTATSTVAGTIATTTSQGANIAPDASTATVNGATIADVATTVAFPVRVTVGASVDGTVVYQNAGPSIATGVAYTLTLSTGLSGVVIGNLPAGATASYDAATGVVTLAGMPASLAASQTASGNGTSGITVHYAQKAGAAGSDVASAIATATSEGANALANAASTTISGALADLAVTKTSGVLSVQLGQGLAYKLRATNLGPADLPAGSHLTDTPSGVLLNSVNCSAAAGNLCVAPPTTSALTTGLLLPAMTAGSFYELVVFANVTVNAGTVSNNAVVAVAPGYVDSNSANDSATDGPLPVSAGPDLAITRTPIGHVVPGTTASYDFTVANRGSGPTTGPITVVETLPAGLTFTSATGTGWSCSASASTVTCTNPGPLAAGASTSVSFTDSVATSATGTLSMSAKVATPNDGTLGTKTADDATTLTPILAGAPDVTLTKTASADTLRAGVTVTFTLTTTNRGSGTTTGAILVADTLPAGLLPASATGTGFTCAITGQTVSCTYSGPGLATGGTSSVTVTATVSTAIGARSITNVACATATGDATPSNDCGSVTIPVALGGTLSIRKELSGELVAGLPGTFRLWVRNTAPTPAAGPISVTDSLPAGLGFVSGSGSGWSCSAIGGVIDCTHSSAIAAGDSSAITLVTSVAGSIAAQIVNCAAITAANAAVATDGARSCVTAHPSTDYRLTLELSTPQYEHEVGDAPEFTVIVRNVGKSPVPAVVLTNQIPRGFAYVKSSSTHSMNPTLARGTPIADPTTEANALSWPLGDMQPGDVVRITYRARIGAGARMDGENITRAIAASRAVGIAVTSNAAVVPVRLRAGVFSDRGVIAGKVYLLRDSSQVHSTIHLRSVSVASEIRDTTERLSQDTTDLGIPGVRVILEDGTGAITDEEGKFNFIDVRSGLHVVKVDRTTLPAGAKLVTLDTRNAGDPYSRFVDLKRGELARADFAEGTRDEAVYQETRMRRLAGGGRSLGDALLTPDFVTQAPPTSTSGIGGRSSANAMSSALSASSAPPRANTQYQPLLPPQSLAEQSPSDPNRWGSVVPPIVAPPAPSQAPTMRMHELPPNPELRSLVATGLFQGRIDLRSGAVSGNDDAFEEAMRSLRATSDSGRTVTSARAALFLKGDIKHAGLLTLGYDTERDPLVGQFRDIRPEEVLPVFGDASVREFDARTRNRLYAQLERGASYTRYGDFVTMRADERRLLLAFDRSLTGAQEHLESERGVLEAFVSRGRSGQRAEEIPARGLSGPYFLSQGGAVENSERVEIVTRDRNQPAVILERRPMIRFQDYTVEPATGRLVFRVAVPSLDASLNPVFVRVSYEVEQGGPRFMTYGGNGALRVGSRLELGALAARDENPLDRQSVLGGGFTAALGAGTYLVGEIAHTATGDADRTGDAWRLELRHRSARAEGRLYALRGDSSFDNRSSTFIGGRSEYGARASASIDSSTRVIGEGLRTEDDRTGGRRDVAGLALERRLAKGLFGELGYRWADQTAAPVTPVLQNGMTATGLAGEQGPIAAQTARARLTARAPGSTRATMFAEYEIGIDGGAHRGTVGGDYRVLDFARLYARHEWVGGQADNFISTAEGERQRTVFGVDADYLRNGQLFSEYRARDAIDGRDAEASIGLRNRWPIAKGLLANTSFERVSPLSGAGAEAALAVTGALEYTANPLWKGSARFEWRTSPTGDDYLGSLGYVRKLAQDWTVLGRTLWDQIDSDRMRGRSQVGLAWRETDRNRVNALFRVENVIDQLDAQGQATSRSRSNVAAALVNVRPAQTFTFSGRYAAKWALDTRDDLSARTTAQLLMGRATMDLTHRLDLGLMASVLGSDGFGRRNYGTGAELGVLAMRNLRVAGGYNLFGFTDQDFNSLGYTQRGPYLDLGFKFDESLFGERRDPRTGKP
ncbi:MAG TPA: SdrD B-like domain-containing protein [Gemmatimonadaceae bacterium]|nr:SdrD B-like domain-containing protein [Gemmatimonadaceae bacterium]